MAVQKATVELSFDDAAIRDAKQKIRAGVQTVKDGLQELEAALDTMTVSATVPPPPPPP
jgi:hypothetical protein